MTGGFSQGLNMLQSISAAFQHVHFYCGVSPCTCGIETARRAFSAILVNFEVKEKVRVEPKRVLLANERFERTVYIPMTHGDRTARSCHGAVINLVGIFDVFSLYFVMLQLVIT